MPNLVVYDGKSNLKMYINVFNMWMDFKEVSELVHCKVFLLTLVGTTQAWHASLQL